MHCNPHRSAGAFALRVALLVSALVAHAAALHAQRAAPPRLSRSSSSMVPLWAPAGVALQLAGGGLRSAAGQSSGLDAAPSRLGEGWPLVIEGAMLGALIGGSLGAHGHGAVLLRRAAKGAGIGATVGGAVGAALYAVEKAVTRDGGAPRATPSNVALKLTGLHY